MFNVFLQLYHLNVHSSKLREDRFEVPVTCLALRKDGGVTTLFHTAVRRLMHRPRS